MELLQEFLSILKIFLGNIYVIKDDLDHFEEKFAKLVQFVLSVRYGSGTIITDPDPTCSKSSGSQRTRTHKHWYWPQCYTYTIFFETSVSNLKTRQVPNADPEPVPDAHPERVSTQRYANRYKYRFKSEVFKVIVHMHVHVYCVFGFSL